uniref:Uncharacterized protein n=1 Tax=Trichuris muris TaxID=70415 RepID=A0A5S6QE33_TRIMR
MHRETNAHREPQASGHRFSGTWALSGASQSCSYACNSISPLSLRIRQHFDRFARNNSSSSFWLTCKSTIRYSMLCVSETSKLKMDMYPCEEDLNRRSPELWPEKVPGVCDVADKVLKTVNEKQICESIHLEPEDISFMNELGKLTPDQVMEQIKKMQQTAYNLGRVEQQELRRGSLLRVLEDMDAPSKLAYEEILGKVYGEEMDSFFEESGTYYTDTMPAIE